jgi:hypothetical protein
MMRHTALPLRLRPLTIYIDREGGETAHKARSEAFGPQGWAQACPGCPVRPERRA